MRRQRIHSLLQTRKPGPPLSGAGPVRKRQFPIVGDGAGYCSWVHLDDAASATVLAVEQKARACQHRRRRTGPGPRVAALRGRVRGSEAADADSGLAGPAAGWAGGGDVDDRGARFQQRQGQAGTRLGAALPLVAAGLQEGRQHLGARHPRRTDPGDPHGAQPRQAHPRRPGGRRLGRPPRDDPGPPRPQG